MMRSLSLVSLLRRYDIRYDPKSHRLRCQGHIINLAAKAFLFVTDNEKLKDDERDGHNKLMETLWDDYKPVEPPSLSEVPLTTTNEFLNWRNKHLQPALITDEYERCSKELPIPEQNGGGYTTVEIDLGVM
ncbi:hypothetical protein HRG_012441 [Hirsutella rhossiliensis]